MMYLERVRGRELMAGAVAALGVVAFWAAIRFGPEDNVRPNRVSDPCAVVGTIPDTLNNQTLDKLRTRIDPAGRCGILATDAAFSKVNPDLLGLKPNLQAGTTGNDDFKDVKIAVPIFGYVAPMRTEGTAPAPEFTTQS